MVAVTDRGRRWPGLLMVFYRRWWHSLTDGVLPAVVAFTDRWCFTGGGGIR